MRSNSNNIYGSTKKVKSSYGSMRNISAHIDFDRIIKTYQKICKLYYFAMNKLELTFLGYKIKSEFESHVTGSNYSMNYANSLFDTTFRIKKLSFINIYYIFIRINETVLKKSS